MTPPRPTTNEPVDPDIDLRSSAQRQEAWRGQGPVVAVVALGGGIGATLRYAASLLWPVPSPGFPWTTLLVNVTGCAVIGVFMVLISEVWTAHRLVRPFFGTGVLGGFTTFSTYAVEIERLVDAGEARTALAYLATTLIAALGAVGLAAVLTRRVLAWRQR
ncbi:MULTISPECIES: fluoride efflux transporter CrcB [Streptomyces]|uniref:fluoride efflux transporter CrcB n=1 Tax=Streptomyces TaxID=1883 RepID=UPI001C2E5E7F|nr:MULTISPECIES: fluoride efflux transporter CrcB [Streptomyces]MBV1949860.1 fluoride efflux transporter CrcB [Streptomyces sp. BV129]BDH08707.1 putative fluoride ion transporter CrcB 1 [Streptomyces seoulensis]